MYKFIQKNQKKMVAVFGVGLMIVFVLPSTMTQRQPQQQTAFHLGSEEVTMGEVRAAHEQWRTLASSSLPLGPLGLVADDLEKHPELFLLLQKEAQQLGIRIPESQVNEAFTAISRQFAMFRRPMPNPAEMKPALHKLMLLSALFERVADGIKPSEPLVLRQMAQNGQRVKLELVHYAADDFKKDVPAPTPEQLQKQFDEFKNTPAGTPGERNPFGFGYLVPSQVQLLYLTVPKGEVSRVVRQSKKEFEWKVQALLRYRANPQRFPSTQQAATQPASKPATTQAAAPTARPFEEVQEQIITDLIGPDVDRKIDEIGTIVVEQMLSDYEARRRKSAPAPAAAAATAPADFGSRQYLDRLAADIEKRFGIKLGVSEINDPKSELALGELKGIGQSVSGELSFPQYVMRAAESFVPEAQRKDPAADVLGLDEPSGKFRDPDGNIYVFQLRDATAAHAPADLNAVKDKVEADLRTKLAFDAAVAAAGKLKEAAGPASAVQLSAASKAAGKDTFTTPGYFDRQGNDNTEPAPLLPGVDLSIPARQQLVTQSFELLAQATPDKPHPTSVIALPAAGRVVVAQLADVERVWKDDQQDLWEFEVARSLTRQRAERLLADYFSFDAVKRRLDLRDPNEKATQTAAAN